jgi:DNA repair protein RadA/Sms
VEKFKTRYICQNCGYGSLKWIGKCPSCEQWDTLVEEVVKEEKKSQKEAGSNSIVYSLSDVSTKDFIRVKSNINEFDRLLGGGIIPGSVMLLGGEPGIGKSTLLLQAASTIANTGVSVLYITGEESIQQVKLRSDRLKSSVKNLFLLSETNVDSIINHLEEQKPQIAIIDSIQTLYSSDFSSAPGSVAQVRECTSILTIAAKKKGISLFLIGHVTKTGAIAGPRVVEHLVDVVLYFEGDTHNRYRILRTLKNRFGSTEEIGIFHMQADGLEEVSNPSEIFLNTRENPVSGSIVVASMEGTRPILVELQALVSPTIFGMPERRTTGLDHRRLAILLAVLEKRVGLRLGNLDVFVNVVGGIKLIEPAVDLGVLLAVSSSLREVPIPYGVVAIGEVGLGGEVRAVNHVERRLSEIERLGFKKVILPKRNKEQMKNTDKIQLVGVDNINTAVEEIIGKSKSLQKSCVQ